MYIRNIRRKNNDYYKIVFDFETITSGKTHETYLCWTYKNDIQQECIGVDNCATDVLDYLPTDKQQVLPIAHNSDYDCRFPLPFLQNVQPIVSKQSVFYILRQHVITRPL